MAPASPHPRSKRLARYICPDTVYHVLNSTTGGLFLLCPTPRAVDIMVGVLAKARQNHKSVSLFATAVLSNHFHMLLQGPPKDVSCFVGYFEREVSRRLGHLHSFPGAMWRGRFKATALPTEQSQIDALQYVLSQGTKEDLVEAPWHWPGLHTARYFHSGAPMRGRWLRGTDYAIARDRQRRLSAPTRINRRDHTEHLELHFDPLPALSYLSESAYAQEVTSMMERIRLKESQRRQEQGKRVLGRSRVLRQHIFQTSVPPTVPWLQRRTLMLTWSNPRAIETIHYRAAFWAFQQAYDRGCAIGQERAPPVPKGAFVGGYWA